jgi:hypothetical protein
MHLSARTHCFRAMAMNFYISRANMVGELIIAISQCRQIHVHQMQAVKSFRNEGHRTSLLQRPAGDRIEFPIKSSLSQFRAQIQSSSSLCPFSYDTSELLEA